MALVVVFDTNILISALLSLRGTPFQCVNLARLRIVQAALFRRKLLRPPVAQKGCAGIRAGGQIVEFLFKRVGMQLVKLRLHLLDGALGCSVDGGVDHARHGAVNGRRPGQLGAFEQLLQQARGDGHVRIARGYHAVPPDLGIQTRSGARPARPAGVHFTFTAIWRSGWWRINRGCMAGA